MDNPNLDPNTPLDNNISDTASAIADIVDQSATSETAPVDPTPATETTPPTDPITPSTPRGSFGGKPVILAAAAVVVVIVAIVLLNVFKVFSTPPAATSDIIISPDPAIGSAPFTVTFDAAPIGSSVRFYNWDFGDRDSGTGQQVTHTYTTVGDYTVRLTATMLDGSKRTAETQVSISNISPQAVAKADKTSGDAPLTVKFDASSSKDPNGSIIKYEWRFDDELSTQKYADGVQVEHTYERAGVYTATLSVTDNNGETTSTDVVIEVVSVNGPQAVIETSPKSGEGTAPLEVEFDARKSSAQEGSIVSYTWDFGDGSTTQRGQFARHTYEQVGEYTATLTVVDSNDAESSAQIEIIVGDTSKKPQAKITPTPDNAAGIVPLSIEVDGGDSTDPDGDIVSFVWQWGDGETEDRGQIGRHTYTTPGEYNLTLQVTDNDGNTDTEVLTVRAFDPEPQPPVADLKLNPNPPTISPGGVVNFDASGSYDPDGNIITYEWDFGDRTVRLGAASISHQYDKVGIYTAKVTLHDNSGLTTEETVSIAVNNELPVAKIKVDKKIADAPATLYFDASDSTGAITSWHWDFGDGVISTSRAPTHIYTKAGTYEVLLRVKDSSGVISEVRETIVIQGELEADDE